MVENLKNSPGKNIINWFPGHMNKALKDIQKQLLSVDVIIYVLDSRAPISSINPSLNKLSQNKPVLYIFNKIDLADEERVKFLARPYKNDKTDYLFLNSTMSSSAKIIKQKITNLAKEKIEKMKNKGVKAVIRAIVVGIPNSGKSTLVNNLCGKAKAITGNRPGVTKQAQWLNIGDNIELCDTPGTLYPKLEDQDKAKNLFYIGSIKDEIIVDTIEVVGEFVKLLQIRYPDLFNKRYENCLTIDDIAKKRGYLISKEEYDYERTASAILDDFRKGRIGRITLD